MHRRASPVTREFLHALAPRIDDVHSPIGPDGNIMGEPKLTVVIAEPGKPLEDGTVSAQTRGTTAVWRTNRLVAAIDAIDRAVRAHRNAVRPTKQGTVPICDEVTRAVEDLHTCVTTICDVDATGSVEGEAVRQIKFSRSLAGLSPLVQKVALRIKTEHACVSVAVAHVEAAIRPDRNVRGKVKMRSVCARNTALAKREQQSSVGRKLEHLLSTNIGQPHIVIAIDGKTVRHDEHASAPTPQKPAGLPVKGPYSRRCDGLNRKGLNPRATRAMKYQHGALAINTNTGCLPENFARREGRPAMHNTALGRCNRRLGAARRCDAGQ